MAKSIKNHWLFSRWSKKMDKEIEKSGFTGTMAKFVAWTGTKMEVSYKNKEIEKIISEKPVIIVANHPAETDVLAISAALKTRRNASMVIMGEFMGISQNLDKHLIPVYIKHRIKSHRKDMKMDIFNKFHSPEQMDYQSAHERNIHSIHEAAKKINQNELVIIFPGGGSKNDGWQAGLGYLIKEVKGEASLVMADISGTSKYDYLRLIPGVGKIMPSFKINFFESQNIKPLKDLEAKEIVKILDLEYRSQMSKKSLSNNNKSRFWASGFQYKTWVYTRSLLMWVVGRLS